LALNRDDFWGKAIVELSQTDIDLCFEKIQEKTLLHFY
jgi:hypothetical protein